MASKTQHLKPLSRAHKRRLRLPWYIDLNGKWLFVLVVVGAALLGLLALAQTGRVVTAGYHLRELQEQEKQLLWEQEDLLNQIAQATDPAALEQWAQENKMIRVNPEEFATIPLVRSDLSAAGTLKPIAQQP